MLRSATRWLRRPDPAVRRSGSFAAQRRSLCRAQVIVRVYYVASLFLLLDQSPHWHDWLETPVINPVWPVAWMPLVGVPLGIAAVLVWTVTSVMLACAFPSRRPARAAAFVGLLQYAAFWNSFGNINHGWHAWVMVSLVFAFLPGDDEAAFARSRPRRHLYLSVFWAAQALVLLFYSMSGAFKIAGAFIQLARGEVHAFAPSAFAHQLAYVLTINKARESLLGAAIIDHPILGWPFYLGLLYIETFAFLAAFRPSAHRTFGMLLILFHLGSILTLTIRFTWASLLVGLILVCSPFPAPDTAVRDAVSSLPLVGDALVHWRRWRKREARPLPAAPDANGRTPAPP